MKAKLVYFFCHNLDRDPVAQHVYNACRLSGEFTNTSIEVDGLQVLRQVDEAENSTFLVRTDEVVTDRYETYLGVMEEHFPDTAAAAVINWHEGAHAPDRIFTIHSNADVVNGTFGKTDPAWMRAII